MKKLFTLVFCLASVFANGQCGYGYIDFDTDTCYKSFIEIDTVHYHHNIWQVGHPHKVNLNSPLSSPNVLITDTLNPYPANDTSVVILKIPSWMQYPYSTAIGPVEWIKFFYRLDIDSNARALVELSIDSGSHWVNVLDSLPPLYSWLSNPKPRFDTFTNWWAGFVLYRGDHSGTIHSDTLQMRFTFISNGVVSGKDGWMIDNIELFYAWESVPLLQNLNLISLYPNPSHGNIYLHTDKPHKDATITIHNIQGQQAYSGAAPANGYLNLQLPNGIYTLRYSDEEEYCVKQIVIQN